MTELIQRHACAIGEHFDTVQIFCTKETDTGTRSKNYGVGNWYARYGQVRDWVLSCEAQTKLLAQREITEEDDQSED